jgi:hypothetical protein
VQREVRQREQCVAPLSSTALEATQGQILSLLQMPTADLPQMPPDSDGIAWELTKETINLPLGCLQGGQGLVERPVRR